MTYWKAFCGAAAMLVSMQSGAAQAACWSDGDAAAAQVREMETMLMVGALRCRIANGNAMLTSYNAFIREGRPALTQANDRLRAHFMSAGSGLNGYDRYVTSLANRYGAGADGLSCAELAGLIQSATSEATSLAGLQGLANEIGIGADLPGGRCAVKIAGR
jgi:hypothetical protein